MTGIDYPKFVAIYMVAYVLVVITHVPGGFGVLELVVLLLVPCQYGSQGFAALIVFRIIYYWAPLVMATVLLGITSDPAQAVALRRRPTAGRTAAAARAHERPLRRTTRAALPLLAAPAGMAAGLGHLSADPGRRPR